MEGDIDVLKGTIYDILALVFHNAGNQAFDEPWMQAIARLRLIYRR